MCVISMEEVGHKSKAFQGRIRSVGGKERKDVLSLTFLPGALLLTQGGGPTGHMGNSVPLVKPLRLVRDRPFSRSCPLISRI